MIRSRFHSLRVPVALLSLASIFVLLSVAPVVASPNGLVISELRFRGPSGANDEFVELKNTSTGPVDISGYRLQGCAATSGAASDRVAVPAGTTLRPGQYYLFTNGSASGGYSGTVAGDQTYATGFSDTAGSQSGARIVDAGGAPVDGVGLPASPCREGTGLGFPTASSPDTAFERKPVGVNDQDTNDNAADFEGPKAGNPQNSGGIAPPPTPACSDGTDNDGDGKIDFSGANPDPGCSSTDDDDETDPPVTRISAVQGSGASTPIGGQTVTIEGVVTGVDDEIGASFGSGNTIRKFLDDAGIFVQEESADEDADPNSSEGVFVGFVRDRGAYQPGDVVGVNGRVTEKFGQTQINETVDQEPTKTGTAPVPGPVAIDEARAEGQNAASRPYYESLEGMRVGLATGTANSGGTNKFGELFLTPGPEQDRVFRDESVPGLIAADSDAGAGDPDNPYRDPDGSTTEVNGDLFDTASNAVGPMAFGFENYRVIVQPGQLPTVADTGVVYPYSKIQPATPDQARIASFNVENFFPAGAALDGGNVTQEESDEKRTRIADAIGRLLKRPDVVALQEVDNEALLDGLAATLNEGRQAGEHYTGYLEEGNDDRGIDVGFLVKATAEATNVRQLGKNATYSGAERCSDIPGGLFDRPPLAADIEIGGLSFTIFSNHFASKAAPDACRDAQAAFVRDEVKTIEDAGGQAIVVGDLNAFETESPLAVLEDGTTTLTNQWGKAPAGEAYSFQFQGRLQTLDHALITDGLDTKYEDFLYAHTDNDYYERTTQPPAEIGPTAAGDADGHKVSDHDPPVLTLDAGVPPPPAAACSDGADNDGDGKADFGGANPDPGCSSADDDDETDPPPPPDTAAPDTTIDSGPSGVENSGSAGFTFSSSESGSTFECGLDAAAFTACDPPEEYTGLADGPHTFRVRATDAAGNTDPEPASRTWTVDTQGPSITPRKPNPGSAIRDRTPKIIAAVSDGQTELAREDITLNLDGRPVTGFAYDGETDRLSYTPGRNLASGRHFVEVTARDEAGNVAAQRWSFRIAR